MLGELSARKMRAAFRHVLATVDFDWLVKCDDDSFIHLERLVQYVAALPIGSRDMVATIAADAAFPSTGREDMEVCKAVLRAGGRVVAEPRFNATAAPSLAPGNDVISCHHLTPAQMQKIHTDCWKI